MPLIQDGDVAKLILPTSAELPEDQQEWVVMDPSPLMGGDMLEVQAGTSGMGLLGQVLPNRIKEWNVKATTGEIAEVSYESIRHLPPSDLAFLLKQLSAGGGASGLPKAPSLS